MSNPQFVVTIFGDPTYTFGPFESSEVKPFLERAGVLHDVGLWDMAVLNHPATFLTGAELS